MRYSIFMSQSLQSMDRQFKDALADLRVTANFLDSAKLTNIYNMLSLIRERFKIAIDKIKEEYLKTIDVTPENIEREKELKKIKRMAKNMKSDTIFYRSFMAKKDNDRVTILDRDSNATVEIITLLPASTA